MTERLKVWVTKYALSRGISAHLCRSKFQEEFFHRGKWTAVLGIGFSVQRGKDAFESKQEALAAVEQMRIKKIASLKKQIAKLEAMKF